MIINFSKIDAVNVFFIFIAIGLFFFCALLLKKVKELKQRINELESENRCILEQKVLKNIDKDSIPMQAISTSKKDSVPLSRKNSQGSRESTNLNQTNNKSYSKEKAVKSIPVQATISKEKQSYQERTIKTNPTPNRMKSIKEPNSNRTPYQKNMLQGKNRITSPVSLSKKETKEEIFNMDQLSLDLNEFIKRSEKVVPKIEEPSKSKDYLKNISDQMASELKPQTIELTDYEKEQEENAIISYQELLSVKDHLNMIEDEEENIDFIEELKKLRNSLE